MVPFPFPSLNNGPADLKFCPEGGKVYRLARVWPEGWGGGTFLAGKCILPKS
jgi:hypothetical protein